MLECLHLIWLAFIYLEKRKKSTKSLPDVMITSSELYSIFKRKKNEHKWPKVFVPNPPRVKKTRNVLHFKKSKSFVSIEASMKALGEFWYLSFQLNCNEDEDKIFYQISFAAMRLLLYTKYLQIYKIELYSLIILVSFFSFRKRTVYPQCSFTKFV